MRKLKIKHSDPIDVCLAVPVGGGIAYLFYDQAKGGIADTFGMYDSTIGQRVLDSFNPETYPGDQNRSAELGIDAGKFIAEAIVVGKAIKYGGALIEKYGSRINDKITDVLGARKSDQPLGEVRDGTPQGGAAATIKVVNTGGKVGDVVSDVGIKSIGSECLISIG